MSTLNPVPTRRPWWREPLVWMVVGFPMVAVVAGITTLVIAIRNPDPVIKPRMADTSAQVPAREGRNHAATPDAPVKTD